MATPFRWGILGTGNIARAFAHHLEALADDAGAAAGGAHRLVAVASRSHERATAFCAELASRPSGAFAGSPPVALEDYGRLLQHPGIDALYVALPNSLHADWSIRGLSAGLHVLCEKPLALSVEEGREMFEASGRAGRVLAEAFMYRCHPQTHGVLEAIRGGAIGRVRHIRTSFCFRLRNLAGNIRMEGVLGGGALMDVGCYCVDFSNLMAGGRVVEAKAVWRGGGEGGGQRAEGGAGEKREARSEERENAAEDRAPSPGSLLPSALCPPPSDVDMSTSALLAYDNGVTAMFSVAMDTEADNEAMICGEEGYITIKWPWKPTPETAGFTLARGIPPRQDLKPGEKAAAPPPRFVPAPANVPLFALEARAFAAACRGEAPPFITEGESLANLEVMERVRRSARGEE